MSSSIAIPTGPNSSKVSKAAASSSSSSYSSSPCTPEPATKSTSDAVQGSRALRQRRPSLLSPAISKQECTTINIGDDGQPRLISYLTSSQGFMWNPEIFLPSYMECDYVPLENRREPVHEILLSDEETKNMFPA